MLLMFVRHSITSTLSDLFTNVAGDTPLKYLKEINLHVYTKIYLDNIRFKYIVFSFQCLFICTYNPIVSYTSMLYLNGSCSFLS